MPFGGRLWVFRTRWDKCNRFLVGPVQGIFSLATEIDLIARSPCTVARCCATAFSRGELLGLQWKHIDFDAPTIQIEQGLWHGQLFSDNSRLFPFGEALALVLSNHFQSMRRKVPTISSSARKMNLRCQ